MGPPSATVDQRQVQRSLVGEAYEWCWLFLHLAYRDLQIALLFVLFPSMLVFIYNQSMGGTDSGFTQTCRVLVVEASSAPSSVQQRHRVLQEALEGASFEGKRALTVYRSNDFDASMRALQDGQVTLVLDGRSAGLELPVYADPTSAMAPYAESFVREALEQAHSATAASRPLRARSEFVGGSGTSNDFLVSVPGLMLFGAAFGGLAVSLLLVREIRCGTMDRLRLSGCRFTGLLAGLWTAQVVLTVLQGLVALGTAWALGFRTTSSLVQVLVAAVLLDLMMAMVAIAVGLLTVSWASSDGSAANLSMFFIAPLAFLSGASFPLPVPIVAGTGAWAFFANDFIPATPMVRVRTNVLVRSQPVTQNLPALLFVLLESLVCVGVAGLVFRARRWRTA